MFEKIWSSLSGRKTYVVAFFLAFASFAFNMGWIDKASYDAVFGLLTATGLATLRAGVEASK